MLISFSGVPGAGKSTTARELARQISAVYLSVDSIEKGVAGGYAEAYRVAQAVAGDNLRLGHTVITDCVNPLRQSRDAWRDIATAAGVPTIEVEVTCSDKDEHLRRLPRAMARGAEEPLTRSEEIIQHYQPWDRERLVIDTAQQTVDDAVAAIRRAILKQAVERGSTRAEFRVVQPCEPHKAERSTLISQHATAADAFAAIDRLASEMVRTSAPSDAVELVVLDSGGSLVKRTDAN
jgi:adenylylsulfate kinase-like enzyme